MIELNTIYNEDCLVGMQRIPDGSVDMICTDPPYGIDFLSHRTDNHHKLQNDGFQDFNNVMPMWISEFKRVLSDTGVGVCFIGGGKTPVSQIFTMEVVRQGLNLVQTLIWDKRTIGLGYRYRPSYETIVVFSKSKDKYNWFTDRKDVSNIIRHHNIIPQKGDHPTPKPVPLMQYLIELHTQRDMVVLEPFMGGGTTIVACIRSHRQYIGFEIDEGYFNMSAKRIELEKQQLSLF